MGKNLGEKNRPNVCDELEKIKGVKTGRQNGISPGKNSEMVLSGLL